MGVSLEERTLTGPQTGYPDVSQVLGVAAGIFVKAFSNLNNCCVVQAVLSISDIESRV